MSAANWHFIEIRVNAFGVEGLHVIDYINGFSVVPVLLLTSAYCVLVVLLRMRPFTLRPVIG